MRDPSPDPIHDLIVGDWMTAEDLLNLKWNFFTLKLGDATQSMFYPSTTKYQEIKTELKL